MSRLGAIYDQVLIYVNGFQPMLAWGYWWNQPVLVKVVVASRRVRLRRTAFVVLCVLPKWEEVFRARDTRLE